MWYSESEPQFIFFFISKMRKGNKERKIADISWENKERKMRGMKIRIVTCFGDLTRSRG